jgi:GAF domain-containing protein
MVPTIDEELLTAMGEVRGPEAADRLCRACVRLLGIDAAAISLVFDGANAGTLGASAPAARRYDEEQFTSGEGPCLDAVARRGPVTVADLADPSENRWPAYGPAMLAHHIRGVHAMPIVVAGECLGAINFFHAQPTTLTDDQVLGVVAAAGLAELPLLDLLDQNLNQATTTPRSDAWAVLNTLTRAEVSQATGTLMAQLHIEAPAALVRLRAHAYATGRSTTDVARDILEHRLRLGPH